MSISQISPFYLLPRELRDEIYKLSFPQHDLSNKSTWARVESRENLHTTHSLKSLENSVGNDDSQTTEDFVLGIKNKVRGSSSQIFPLPPICLASKTTYHEAVPLFLQSSTIYCSSPSTTHYLLNWLAKFPHPDGYGSIRSLAIQYGIVHNREYEGFSRSHQQDLFGNCTNLRCLTLVFQPSLELMDLQLCNYTSSTSMYVYEHLENTIVKPHQFEEVIAIPRLEKLVLDFSFGFDPAIHKLNGWYAGRWKEEGRAVALECKFVVVLDDGDEHIGTILFD